MDVSDLDLAAIKRIQRGDEGGLVVLMSRHRESIFRFVYRFVRNEADAAELTEQTFLKVFLKADSFRPKAKVSTWMFAIAGNLCRDFLRRRKRSPAEFSLDASAEFDRGSSREECLAGNSPSPGDEAVTEESLAAIGKAVDDLPHKLKFPFVFCVLENHSYDECAEVLRTNRKTVETRIYRARQLLRTELAGLTRKS